MSADEQSFPSTYWEWKRVKMRRPPEARREPPQSGVHISSRPPRNPREPLKITISYRGGPEAWYEIHTRGCVLRFPGVVALHDAMSKINQSGGSV